MLFFIDDRSSTGIPDVMYFSLKVDFEKVKNSE